MLTKLIKQEFRATARVMIPMYLVMLALAVGARFFTDDLGDLGDLLKALCALAVLACILVNVAAMILRFKQNLLGDEGYLMFTLPVTVHQHLWAKLVAAVAWFAATLAISLGSLCILADSTAFTIGAGGIQVGIPLVSVHGVAVAFPDNGLFLLELAVLGFVAGCTLCLQFYAALAAGYSFSSHKMALSVVWFVLLSLAHHGFDRGHACSRGGVPQQLGGHPSSGPLGDFGLHRRGGGHLLWHHRLFPQTPPQSQLMKRRENR